MFGPELRAWVVGLDENTAVALTRALLLAEASRLGLPAGAVRMTGNVKARDRGVDGRTDFPPGATTAVPLGLQTWQVKATTSKPVIQTELQKVGVLEDLAAGRDYVLVWTRDPPLSRAEIEQELRDRVMAVAQQRTGILFGTEDLERLAHTHPAVIQAMGGPAMLGLPLVGWAEHLKPGELPFVSDEARDLLLSVIREFAALTNESTVHLHVFGDTGVGKSRLVLEALNIEPLANSVFACTRADRVKTDVLEAIVTSASSAILVVDDVSQLDAENLAIYAAGARGRLRLITVGGRPRRDSVAGQATLEVRPLGKGVIASLVSNVTGLTAEQATLVASLADGYPKLAIELAQELAGAEDVASVVMLLKNANVSALLERMIPDEATRSHIAHLALVDRLGFEESLAFETEQLCDTFELDRLGFISAVQTEFGRFVSDAGRYRLATPLALAMWLIRDLIQQAPAAFADRVVALPEQLFDAFRRQIEVLGDDRLIGDLLKEVMARKGGTFLRASDMTLDFARLLRAVSFAIPDLAATRINELIVSDDVSNLSEIRGATRRELVWALSHLLWFETTFEASAEALLRLALAENEDYGNNATGTLVGAFGVHLGGTEVPLSHRLGWLRTAYRPFGTSGSSLAIRSAARALETMETRIGGWGGSRLQPKEWRPSSIDEEQRVRSEALRLLLDIASGHSEVTPIVAQEIGEHFRGLVSRGMLEQAIAAVTGAKWTASARGEIASGLRACLHYDTEIESSARQLIQETLESLQGESLEERVEVALTTKYWDLAVGVEERLEGPPILEELAEAVGSTSPFDLVPKFAVPDPRFDETTVAQFYEHLGRLGLPAGEAVAADGDLSLAARTGYVIGRYKRGDRDWATETVRSWTKDSSLAAGVAIVIHQMSASPETLALAIEPVQAGHVPLSSLNRLMLGAWIKPLSAKELDMLLSLYSTQELSYHDLDAALHMVLFWLGDDGREPTERLLATSTSLMLKTSNFPDSTGGLPYVRARLLELLPLSDDQRLTLILMTLQQPAFPSEEELKILDSLASKRPQQVVRAIVQLLLSYEHGWSLYLDRATLLSRVRRIVGDDALVSAVTAVSKESQEQLLRHLDFLGSSPDPIFLALLESRADESFLQAASIRYMYPGEVVVGSYADYLERRLENLHRWEYSVDSPALHKWIAGLVASLQGEIQRERLKEAEEGHRD